ncbi:S-adenosyl-L-methionine-dependent methyltransferase [Acididesulfobacillus acetoxydans]|uniref:Methyltransferase domain n=1 Tax=Acididesulfobacillus acetoxydans TaxID=1561005 RepID=A0A8S0XCF5_9FIRM|nr:class I SAM-dependent methyltransferase [Acididesulfobacillus acetoxydans]CAA7602386.1 S-adenosyl-L-methionine-dependent methyltransferase [Acididesulfobacillus acetoxydans]CEJ08379.1 Methyltransferase domain [Acididesulfobacillus acetoxydans]
MSFMKKGRRKKDLAITGLMAKWYDKNTRKSRLAEMGYMADLVSQAAPAGGEILEIAPGPGYLSIELASRGFSVTGVELSGFCGNREAKRRGQGCGGRFQTR